MSNEKSITKRLTYLRSLTTQVSKKLGYWGNNVYRIDGNIFLFMFKYSVGNGVIKGDIKSSYYFGIHEKIVPLNKLETLIKEMKDILEDDKEFHKAKINRKMKPLNLL